MWQASRAGGPGAMVRAGVAVIAVALLTGCEGSPVAAKPPDHLGKPTSTVALARPHGGSPAQALGVARRLLASLVLPAGSHVTNVPLTGRLRQQAGMLGGSTGMVDVRRLFSLGLPIRRAGGFLRAHTPPGMRGGGNGQVGVATAAVQSLTYSLGSPPPGIFMAQVAETVVPAPGGRSLLRADAQVMWYPPRTAAERIDPGRYGAVILKGRELFPSHRVTRRITSKAIIARLAAMLNGMYAAPNLEQPCPLYPIIYRVGFAATAHSKPILEVSNGGCETLQVIAGGKGQPMLLDSGGRFTAAAVHLLGLRLP